MARIESHNDSIIRDPEGFDDMKKKYLEREAEAEARVREKAGSEDPLKAAQHKLAQLKHRRDIKPLDDKATKTEPSDPAVLEVKNTIIELSRRIDTAIKQDPEANRAVLRGRVKLGKPEGNNGTPPAA